MLECGQDVPRLAERGGDNVLSHLQKVEDPWVANLVKDRGTLLAGLHNVGPPQRAKVLGEVGRLQAYARNQLADGTLPIAQKLKNLNTGGVRQSPKQLCSDLVNGTGDFFILQEPPRTGVIRWIICQLIWSVEPNVQCLHLTNL